MHFFPPAPHLPVHQIDTYIAHLDHRALGFGQGPLAKRRANSRQQFIHVEGLGHIVVGAEIECGDFLLGLLARGHNDQPDRWIGAQRGDQFQAVAIRQSEVQQDEVRVVDSFGVERLARRRGLDDPIAGALQSGAQQDSDLGLVLDDQYLIGVAGHQPFPCRARPDAAGRIG